MTRKDAIAELIAKVEAVGGKEAVGYYAARVFNPGYAHAINAHLGSLDAAKALHEAVLPGWTFVIGPAAVHLWRNEDYGDPFCAPYEGKSDNPARAWLLAILRALHAQEQA
jgi:hypothetical protein